MNSYDRSIDRNHQSPDIIRQGFLTRSRPSGGWKGCKSQGLEKYHYRINIYQVINPLNKLLKPNRIVNIMFDRQCHVNIIVKIE